MNALQKVAQDAARIGIDPDTALSMLSAQGFPLTYSQRVSFRMEYARTIQGD